MRKQNFRNLLRNSMQDVETPVRYEHLQKTISLAKNEWKKRVVRPRITFSKFLTTQIRFVGWKIWLAQAIVLLCLSYLLVFFGDYILNNQRNVALLLCCISILVLMSAVPFIQRSIRFKTYEIEAAARFSATKQLLAKLLIIGIGDISMLSSILCVAIINTPLGTKSILLYLLLPFLIASSGLLYLIGHTPIEKISQNSVVICMVLFLAFTILDKTYPIFYQQAFSLKWAAICIVLILFCIYQIRYILYRSSYEEMQLLS